MTLAQLFRCDPTDKEAFSEAGTDYWSPCCEGHGLYAHFMCCPDRSEVLIGFQCTECGANYDPSEKDGFVS